MRIFAVLFLIIFAINSAAFAAPRADFAEVSKTVNNFNWNYFSKLDKDKNIFYSPYSLAAALSVLSNGAKGYTQKEILKVLSAKKVETLNEGFQNFRAFMKENYNDGTILSTADLILIDEKTAGAGINSNFKNTVENFYGAEVEAADFAGNLDAEKLRIKNFVAKNTNNFIPDYESSVDKNTIFDLLDVIYFKGKWENTFDAKKTWKSDFMNRDGSKSKVQMMAQTFDKNISYYADKKYMGIVLPYEKNISAMLVILPVAEENLNVAESWDAESISYKENFLLNLQNSPKFYGIVEVFIPKFELDIKNNLNKDLKALGIRRAFTNIADFKNIIETRLKISNATHQAKIKVDEEGTEAAAITEISLGATATAEPPRRIYFRADRPFLFVIRDIQSEMNLFTGVVNKFE